MRTYEFTLPLHLIQNIRFCLALAEIGISISVPQKWVEIFKYLSQYFDIAQSISHDESSSKLRNLDFSHKDPYLYAFGVCKNIVFPNAIVIYLKDLWPKERNGIIFQGLITEQREKTLQNWLNKKSNIVITSKYLKIKRRVFRKLKKSLKLKHKAIEIIESSYGREFPIKAWDQNYFDSMINKKFVICPNGDYIWTYRFFESILCGAIPLVEESCPLYDGFKYYNMNEYNETLVYSEEVALHNFSLLVERTTYNKDEIETIKGNVL